MVRKDQRELALPLSPGKGAGNVCVRRQAARLDDGRAAQSPLELFLERCGQAKPAQVVVSLI